MPIDYHGIGIFHWILFSLFVDYGIGLIIFFPSPSPSPSSSHSCMNISVSNVSFGRIHSLNFYSGQSQPPNVSCSWNINHFQTSVRSNYILSLRVIEFENDSTQWSNELSFWTGSRQISVDDINKRTYPIPTLSSSLQIYFRTKTPTPRPFNSNIHTNLRIRRFLIEFLHMDNELISNNNDNYFRCLSSGILIPKQWRCNCIVECPYDDDSDEKNCPLCSMYEPSGSLLCQSNEIWCLPKKSNSFMENLIDDESEEYNWMQTHLTRSRKIDPKGVCIPRDDYPRCAHSTNTSNCQTILAWRQDRGQILLDNITLHNYQTLCFVIIAKDEYSIKILLHQYSLVSQRPDFEWIIYDGSENQNQILLQSNQLPMRETVQTHENHIATIIIRKRFISPLSDTIRRYRDDDVLGHFDTNETTKRLQRREVNSILLNITWFTNICPDDQMLCAGHFETKCYTAEQRCDGIWDCISGDDELGCSPESCPTTFACNDRLRLPTDQPRCYTWSERCNGNSFCANRTDERFCSKWWCNSNNGTFLCKNLNCVYETWVCDGTDDCGDRSDETDCPSRVPRRIVTAAVIGATVCSTLFIIALGCTCKLFHLRTAERRAASRLLNPQRYIEQRRQQLQREQQRLLNRQNCQQTSTTTDPSAVISEETRRIAPPSYNQTMGLTDENEERHAALAEHLRLAGLANYISLPPVHGSSRTSRSTSRHRHRRHRRHRHYHHHHRRAHSEGSRVALLEPNVVVPSTAFAQPCPSFSLSRFNRFRSQLRAFFTAYRPTQANQNHSASNPMDVYEQRHRSRPTSVPPIVLTTRPYTNSDFIHPRELPPPYTEEQLILSHPTGPSLPTPITNSRRSSSDGSDLDSTNTTTTTTTSSSSLYRLRKRQLPANTLRDRMRQFMSGSTVHTVTDELSHPMQRTTTISTILDISLEQPTPIAPIENAEQPSSEDDKLLTP